MLFPPKTDITVQLWILEFSTDNRANCLFVTMSWILYNNRDTFIYNSVPQHILWYIRSSYLLLGRINLFSSPKWASRKNYYIADQNANHKNIAYVLLSTHHKMYLIYLLVLSLLLSFFSFCSFASSANWFSNFLVILLIFPTGLHVSPIILFSYVISFQFKNFRIR